MIFFFLHLEPKYHVSFFCRYLNIKKKRGSGKPPPQWEHRTKLHGGGGLSIASSSGTGSCCVLYGRATALPSILLSQMSQFNVKGNGVPRTARSQIFSEEAPMLGDA